MRTPTPREQYEIAKNTSVFERRLLAVAYLGSSSLVLIGGYAIHPIKQTHLFYDRLFTLMGCWDEPLPVFATMLTWMAVFFAVLAVTTGFTM